MELGDIWNKTDDKEISKVMAEKQVIERDAILAHFTPQSQEESVIADSKEEGNNKSLPESAIDNHYLLPNQPILPPIVSSEILSSLINIFGTNILLLSEIFFD